VIRDSRRVSRIPHLVSASRYSHPETRLSHPETRISELVSRLSYCHFAFLMACSDQHVAAPASVYRTE
jgi:hypothetical protein